MMELYKENREKTGGRLPAITKLFWGLSTRERMRSI